MADQARLERNANYKRRIRAERVQNGLCPRCGTALDDGHRHCRACREYNRSATRRYRRRKGIAVKKFWCDFCGSHQEHYYKTCPNNPDAR